MPGSVQDVFEVSGNDAGFERRMAPRMTGGSIQTADALEFIERPATLSGTVNAGNVRPRPIGAGRTTRLRVRAGESGERVGWVIGRIVQRLSGASAVSRQTGERIPPAVSDPWQPEPASRHGEQRLKWRSRDTRPETLPAVTRLPLKVTGSIQPDQAFIVAHPRAQHPLAPAPITYIPSGLADRASSKSSDDRRTLSLDGSRTLILAAEAMEMLAHVPRLRNLLSRILGPRGTDLLFLGTSLAGMLLPLIASENIDGFALFMTFARFGLGLLIEPWWVDLLFGITGIAMFLFEHRQHRRARFAG